jgi:hypothetical protein
VLIKFNNLPLKQLLIVHYSQGNLAQAGIGTATAFSWFSFVCLFFIFIFLKSRGVEQMDLDTEIL